MNAWHCDEPNCQSKCVGVGGAIGLRAVGWYFNMPRGKLYCPQHRPDKIKGDKEEMGCELEKCGQCAGRKEAHKWQRMIERKGE